MVTARLAACQRTLSATHATARSVRLASTVTERITAFARTRPRTALSSYVIFRVKADCRCESYDAHNGRCNTHDYNATRMGYTVSDRAGRQRPGDPTNGLLLLERKSFVHRRMISAGYIPPEPLELHLMQPSGTHVHQVTSCRVGSRPNIRPRAGVRPFRFGRNKPHFGNCLLLDWPSRSR